MEVSVGVLYLRPFAIFELLSGETRVLKLAASYLEEIYLSVSTQSETCSQCI